MGKPSSETTNRVTSPAPQFQPFLTSGLTEAERLSQTPAQFPGQAATQGQGTFDLASQQFAQTLGGNFLSGGQGFNEAVEAATRRQIPGIRSGFELGGRTGGGLSRVAEEQAFADAFASQFGNERNRQIALAQAAPGFAQSQFDFGSQVQNFALEDAQRRNQQFIGSLNNLGLQGFGNEQFTAERSGNFAADALGIAAVGANIWANLTDDQKSTVVDAAQTGATSVIEGVKDVFGGGAGAAAIGSAVPGGLAAGGPTGLGLPGTVGGPGGGPGVPSVGEFIPPATEQFAGNVGVTDATGGVAPGGGAFLPGAATEQFAGNVGITGATGGIAPGAGAFLPGAVTEAFAPNVGITGATGGLTPAGAGELFGGVNTPGTFLPQNVTETFVGGGEAAAPAGTPTGAGPLATTGAGIAGGLIGSQVLPAITGKEGTAPIGGVLGSGAGTAAVGSGFAAGAGPAIPVALAIMAFGGLTESAEQAGFGREVLHRIRSSGQSLSTSPAGIEGMRFTDPITDKTVWVSPAAITGPDARGGQRGFALSDAGDGNPGLWHPAAGVRTQAMIEQAASQALAQRSEERGGLLTRAPETSAEIGIRELREEGRR